MIVFVVVVCICRIVLGNCKAYSPLCISMYFLLVTYYILPWNKEHNNPGKTFNCIIFMHWFFGSTLWKSFFRFTLFDLYERRNINWECIAICHTQAKNVKHIFYSIVFPPKKEYIYILHNIWFSMLFERFQAQKCTLSCLKKKNGTCYYKFN